MTESTLVYMFRGNEVLLAMKKRGHGVGKWNAPGGKLKAGETLVEAAVRETQEEVGMAPALGRELGRITYHDDAYGELLVHVFRTSRWKGEPVESEEMKPQWWPIIALPYGDMWEGDDQWLPKVISDYPFSGEIWSDGKGGMTKIEIKTP